MPSTTTGDSKEGVKDQKIPSIFSAQENICSPKKETAETSLSNIKAENVTPIKFPAYNPAAMRAESSSSAVTTMTTIKSKAISPSAANESSVDGQGSGVTSTSPGIWFLPR